MKSQILFYFFLKKLHKYTLCTYLLNIDNANINMKTLLYFQMYILNIFYTPNS